MRIKDRTAQSLIDLPVLQAERLGNRHYERAIKAGHFDPYPDGTLALGDPVRRGTLAQNSGITEPAIAGGALSGFDGALPDHLQAALQKTLHDDDKSLQAFLAIFDRRLLELRVQAEKAQVLVSTQDARGQAVANFLDRFARIVGRSATDTRHLKSVLPLLSRVCSLEGLRNLVSWWTGRRVHVTASFDSLHPIEPASTTRLNGSGHQTARLGRGAILGRFGMTPTGRLSVYITCDSREEFRALADDSLGISELRSVAQQYLRNPVPLTFYADVARYMIKAPVISARVIRADQLGAYNMLAPEQAPNARAFLKLSDFSA